MDLAQHFNRVKAANDAESPKRLKDEVHAVLTDRGEQDEDQIRGCTHRSADQRPASCVMDGLMLSDINICDLEGPCQLIMSDFRLL